MNFRVGINNIETFKSSGKFVCEIPGLYFISVHLRTNTKNNAFYVRKNDIVVATSASDADDTYSNNPISAVIKLQLKDTLYVDAPVIRVLSTYSCLSIMKVG